MKVNFGIVAVKRGKPQGFCEIVHFCGYEKEPTEYDYEGLWEELNSDPEFDLIGVDFMLLAASPEQVAFYSKVVGDAQDGGE